MSTSSEKEQGNNIPEKKKVSLEEAIKLKLAQKKQEQHEEKQGNYSAKGTNKMKSQQTKKANNQRRRTGA